jgi:hypothetical protein
MKDVYIAGIIKKSHNRKGIKIIDEFELMSVSITDKQRIKKCNVK